MTCEATIIGVVRWGRELTTGDSGTVGEFMERVYPIQLLPGKPQFHCSTAVDAL
jgi:hypothetical protein